MALRYQPLSARSSSGVLWGSGPGLRGNLPVHASSLTSLDSEALPTPHVSGNVRGCAPFLGNLNPREGVHPNSD